MDFNAIFDYSHSRYSIFRGIFGPGDGISGRFCYFCSLKIRKQDTVSKVQATGNREQTLNSGSCYLMF
jgi:hypothetical protein